MIDNKEQSILTEVLREVKDLTTCQRELTAKLNGHIEREEAKLDFIVAAFPDGDPRGHREYHDALIAAAAQRVRLRQAIIEKTLIGLIWAGVIWIGIALWQGFRHALGLS